MRRFTHIVVFSILFVLPAAYTQDKEEIKPDLIVRELPFGLKELLPRPKPVVALALSGGGARGIAQVGVLRALEESDICPDIIVGTSMGSIIGGLYSSGYSIEELDTIARQTNWDELLTISRQSNRRDLFVDQKISEDRAVFSLRLDGLNPILPTSFNDGQKLSNYLNIITFNAPVHPNETFDQLKIKFRAVCTNLVNGDVVVLRDGTLSKALRASSSVTFFLPPVQLDSLILVDGGLAENIPVSTSKLEGGEFIIAVNTTSPLHREEKLSAPWIIADQIVSIPMKHLNSLQLDSADIVITPDLNDRASNNFKDIDQIIKAGYDSALPVVEKIKEKIHSEFLNNLASNGKDYTNPVLIGEYSIKESEILRVSLGKENIDTKDILLALYDLISLGDYEDIKAIVVRYEDRTEIEFLKTMSPVIKRVNLIGSTAVNSESTGKIFSDIIGKHYGGRKVLSAIINLLREYRRIGYSLANVSEISFNEASGALGIFIDEGIISSILTEGNEYSDADIITREFPLKEGDFFNVQKISEGLKNLRGTKLFEDAEVILQKENGKNNLIIKVVERASQLMRVGFSVDDEKRARVAFDFRDENLFGSGTELGLLVTASSKDRGIMLEQKSNRIFDTYLTYKINAFYRFNDISAYRDKPQVSQGRFSREKYGEYRQIFYGGSFGIGAQVERFGNLIFEGKYQINRAKSIEENPVSPFKIKLVSFKVNATVDTQDKYPYPERGIYFNGFYETAQTILGGDLGYTNIGFQYKNYLRLSTVSVLSTKVDMGFGDKTLPLTQQYSLGGLDSFFGMRENEFRGRQLFLTSLMFRYKLPFAIFFDTYLAARYDLGNVWEIQEQIKFKNLRHGIGISMSLDTPIGPAEFAIGRSFLFRRDIPENPVSWGDVRFYFSIGYYY